MKPLLYLCHRLPYPPDKGDKIRSFHILEALRSRYQVHVGTFVDAEEDWAHVETLRARVAGLCVRPLPRLRATARSLTGLLTGEALTLPFYRDAGLKAWVRDLVRDVKPQAALVYSSSMAQYLEGTQLPVKVMDFCDLDSDKWAQYAKSKRQPWRWVYGREARLLAKAEQQIAQSFNHSLFISELETGLFNSQNPELAPRVGTLGNGVDTQFFDPAQAAPLPDAGPLVVFTGAMDYWANVDAVRWFAQEAWPLVRKQVPAARFAIVGSKPAPEVQQLASEPGILVTGRVPDVRPWLLSAAVVVAPLRIARGVQNKVLEAMAMARPVVASSAALQGIGAIPCADVHRTDDPAEFAAQVIARLVAPAPLQPASDNRRFVEERFGWTAALKPLWPLLEQAA
jgi:sugar transferase (PEP-CTERM/EpsH1 system associated)